eukprot:TRINITY_DN13778_c0_g1_i1.p1 TRINITY_DN13778_c0_g1~~TRINITY_DN13778_c0_g1_i1.p1  ORF type:complete len:238 (+),score=28.70 TRINITY_DN13778_c0_g1_i1:54-716(+)
MSFPIASDKDFDDFRKHCEDETGWEDYKTGRANMRVSKKYTNDKIFPVRVVTIFSDLAPEVLYDVLHDHEYRKVWDTQMIEGKVIELLDSRNEVGYYSAKGVLVIANRDFVNQRSWRHNAEKGEWTIINHSVSHPQYPDMSGFVRAKSIKTGYLILRNEGGGSRFIYYTQSDPMGWIPGWAINQLMTTFAPKMVDTLYKAASDYTKWKNEHNPTHKPWLQ